MESRNILNVSKAISDMRVEISKVNRCTTSLKEVATEIAIEAKSTRINISLIVVTVITLLAFILRQFVMPPIYYYCILALLGIVAVNLIFGKFDNSYPKVLEQLCAYEMIVVLAACLCPVLPDLLANVSMSVQTATWIRLIGIILLAVHWIISVVYNYYRKKRIWDLLNKNK